MGAEVQEQKKHVGSGQDAAHDKKTGASASRPALADRWRSTFAQVKWRVTLLTALVMAAGWCLLVFGGSWLNFIAGIVPVTAGLFLGRKVKENLLVHGVILGVTGLLIGWAFIGIYGGLSLATNGAIAMPMIPDADNPQQFKQAQFDELLAYYLSFSFIALIPFPAFGTIMAGRAEQRQREARQYEEDRGGRLERPGAVRTLEDLRGLPLPQLGSYVINLFRKKGFTFKDYRFLDKDKHLDLELEYQGEAYLLRLSVADKVRPGTVEMLAQDMRSRSINRGLVITSTEFTESLKGGKGRRNIVLVDGQMLFDMAES